MAVSGLDFASGGVSVKCFFVFRIRWFGLKIKSFNFFGQVGARIFNEQFIFSKQRVVAALFFV